MDAKKVITILKRKTTIPGDGFTYEDINKAIDFAINEVRKCIPLKPIREPWTPNRCPNCGEDLGGDCYDGYYDNPYFEYCPNCRQKLNYEW